MDLLYEINEIFVLIVYQFKLMFVFWILGILAGVLISVFFSAKIGDLALKMGDKGISVLIFAAFIGAVSPICMYGTIPVMAVLSKKGLPHYILASFMVSSVLINPNLFVVSFALGVPLALGRIFVSILAGITAGILVKCFFNGNGFFDFRAFNMKKKCSSNDSILIMFFKELNSTIVKITPYFITGIILTALFDRYFPKELISFLFSGNRGLGVLLAASLGVPVYFCGGGSIPLLNACLNSGMSYGSAIAFMITGPATKINNLSAIKVILGVKNFALYIIFIMAFSIVSGLICDYVFLKI